ncbi:MAG: AAA family ATPase [Gemmatimonadaceae bacterium]|nr:AAA family ATPase [Gemmatimonadaceae bacterium]
MHLRSIERKRGRGDPDRFPFGVPAIRSLPALEFRAAVTFFVGENGSGKSTLLEGIAAAVGLPTIGTADSRSDGTLGAQRELAADLRLGWTRRATRGFFLRAEDFFGFTKALARQREEMVAELGDIAASYADASAYARGLREGPIRASLHDMEQRYGVDLDANSHGQSFLTVFRSRFVPGGLYLLDEPEAPLSPQSQLALIAMLMEMVAQESQFIIATHSPILLAFPGAEIWSFDESPVAAVPYASLDHVTITRDFLIDPQRFLRHL